MSSITTAVLMCHAPIVIPAVAGARAARCASSTRTMREAAAHLVARQPDALVVISPHTPRHRAAWGLTSGARLQGSMARFGRPEVRIDLPHATESARGIARAAEALGLPVSSTPATDLDHGATVPLCFAVEAGWTGPTLVIALPWPGPLDGTEARMGEAIATAVRVSGQRWAILASGDMSHRLIPGAPAGHHPRAREFDAAIVELVAQGRYREVGAIDPVLRDLAAEDVVQSVEVAAAAVEWRTDGHRKLGYEGPFGVGYLQAVLYDQPTS